MTFRSTIGFLFAGCALLSACASPAPGDPDVPVRVENPGSGAWQDAGSVPFRFVLEETFGVEEEPSAEVLGGVNALATDGDGNVYLLDSRASRILAFDEDATLRWTYGQPGEGPGELQRAYALEWDGRNRLFVGNQGNTRIDIVDTNGRYLDTQTLGEIDLSDAQLVGFLDSTTIALSSSIFGKFASSVTVASVGTPWSNDRRFEVDRTGDLTVPDGFLLAPTVGVAGSDIVVADIDAYRLSFFDRSGTLTRTVSRDVAGLMGPGHYSAGGSAVISVFSRLSTPVAAGNGYWLVQAYWPTNVDDPDQVVRLQANDQEVKVTSAYTMDLYDRDWRLLYAWTLEDPEPGIMPRILHADAQGRVYAYTDAEFPQIGRYRVEVVRP